MSNSRIPGLYRLGVGERIEELVRLGWLADSDAVALQQGRSVLSPTAADKIIENVIATFGLPLAIAPNFLVNGRDFVVPLVVEEPSIVAALSSAARLARSSGGFEVESEEALLTGQVHLANLPDIKAGKAAITDAKDALLTSANGVHPRLVARGGGVRDLIVRELELPDGVRTLVVHLLVDTCDAMGANLVNTICEAVAPELAALCGGTVAMSILSNLADRSLVTARVRYPLAELAQPNERALAVRDAIVRADQIAHADPGRAATHNKGIMNGIDSLAIATGNDWRAIEAGAHAYAARDGQYRSLTRWSVHESGDLCGEICLPLKVGVVGGTISANPAAALGLRIAGVESAVELAGLMAAVGLAQNFAAIRALVTTGIQQGHMRLHARSAAASAGVVKEFVEDLVGPGTATAAGKVILLGEHAVVYGKHALALPISNAVSARVTRNNPQSDLPAGFDDGIALIAHELGVDTEGVGITVQSKIPRAMGLGSSAAIAVAIIRGFDVAFDLGIDDQRVNAIAYECEKLAHGTPSGVDNTMATFATPMLFRRDGEFEISPIELAAAAPIVIAFSGATGMTIEQVAAVRARREKNAAHYDAIFDEIDAISCAGARALASADYAQLGSLMNICHGLLNSMEVSNPELEGMVSIARASGAAGAKLTGAGGGGSIVAICPGTQDAVEAALVSAGFGTMTLDGARGGDRG